MSPFAHRAVRLLCLAGAAPAPLFTALVCREIARYAVNHALPKAGLKDFPELTQMLIKNVADGSFPLPIIGLLTSTVIAAAGAYAIFSKRLTAETAESTLMIIYCVSYSAALSFMGSSLMALVLPFLPMDAN